MQTQSYKFSNAGFITMKRDIKLDKIFIPIKVLTYTIIVTFIMIEPKSILTYTVGIITSKSVKRILHK